jgi:hypothetical protein
LTVSGRLVASDVSKVLESRTKVKSYFQIFCGKGLKYVIPIPFFGFVDQNEVLAVTRARVIAAGVGHAA